MRATLPAVGIAVILLACGSLLNRFYTDPTFLPPDDFLQYWAAGRLNATGGDPYDADRLLELQREAGRPADKPAVLMWNPPWVLTLAMPFGMLPPRTAQLLWLFAQIATLLLATDRIWFAFGGQARWRPWVWAGSLAFYPVMYLVFAGQGSGWLLLGLVGLLMKSDRRAAALLPFLAIKPHLFLPIWIVLALDACRDISGRRRLALGVAVGILTIIVPMAVNPDVWRQYFDAMNRPMDAAHSPLSGWKSPLIGYWVRAALAPEAFWIQAVPTAFAAILTPIYWWKRRGNWDPSTLVLAGLIASPYGAWPYDQIVLLVPVLAGLAAILQFGSRSKLILGMVPLGLANVVALAIRDGEYFVWAPLAAAAWYAWAIARTASVTPECHSASLPLAGAAP